MLFDENIPTIAVADSEFIGFVKVISTKSEAHIFQNDLKKEYPKAAHIPICWVVSEKCIDKSSVSPIDCSVNNDIFNVGFDEDGEPKNSCGEILLKETKRYFETYTHLHSKVDCSGFISDKEPNKGINTPRTTEDQKGLVLAIVRFFGNKLLGVTCGRLTQCYRSIAILTLHRFLHGKDVALHQCYNDTTTSVYGMGAGDCELILDILTDIDGADDPQSFPQQIVNEINFNGFKGNLGEELPRLQNLQADVTKGTIPVYRYPGNYVGDEWKTFQWSRTSLQVKHAVEEHLKPLVHQEMNHCVSNFYRDGNDFIDHHSDKDLDLKKDAVIVSVSLGDERYLELKRRAMPRDTLRIKLPHGSMLVLGPKTNKTFTHSILKKEESVFPRMSLTFRHVVTFMDLNTRRIYGEGAILRTHDQLQKKQCIENTLFTLGFTSYALFLVRCREKNTSSEAKSSKTVIKECFSISSLFALTFVSFRKIRLLFHQKHEEQRARAFFSKTSVNGTKY